MNKQDLEKMADQIIKDDEKNCYSSIKQFYEEKSYIDLKAIGWAAVPMLLERNKKAILAREEREGKNSLSEDGSWIWIALLRQITNFVPFSKDDSGKLYNIQEAWRKWGETKCEPINSNSEPIDSIAWQKLFIKDEEIYFYSLTEEEKNFPENIQRAKELECSKRILFAVERVNENNSKKV